MVTHLLKLRLLLLKNSLLRNPWRLVAVALGGFYGLGLLGLTVVGLVALSGASIDVTRTVVVLGGSATVLGWVLIPIIAAGTDQTLDPARLVTYPIPLPHLLTGLTVCGLIGIPGSVTLLGAVATMASWWRHPLIAVIAGVCAVAGTLTCIIGSRMVAALTAGLARRRRYREVSSTIILVPLMLLVPIIASVSNELQYENGDGFTRLANMFSWTPLGAIWAVPADVAGGDFARAGAEVLIAVVTLAVITLTWKHLLVVASATPAHTASRGVSQGKLGFFRLFPASPSGAIAARSLTYWLRDPRYTRQLIVVPLLPVLFFYFSSTVGAPGIIVATGPFVAVLLSLSIIADISYDHTAFATHIASGVSGAADRAGRVAAVASFSVPVVIALTVASAGVADAWRWLPGLLGLSLGILFTGFGVSSVSSAKLVFPVPAAGDSPFASPPGSGFLSGLTTFASWGVLAVLVVPELALVVAGAVVGLPELGYAALIVGVTLGALFMLAGIRQGGALLESRAPELLAQLQRQHGSA